jgi:uncharacterized protein YndB with AHSA1/START domain
MADLEEHVRIRTNPPRIYEVLTRTTDVCRWWTAKSTLADAVGGTCTIGAMTFRIDALERQRRIAWTCTGHAAPAWIGTTLAWTISPVGDHVIVTLVHAGWKDKVAAGTAETWQRALASLRAYVETGTGQPA